MERKNLDGRREKVFAVGERRKVNGREEMRERERATNKETSEPR